MGPFSRKQIQKEREEYIFQITEEILSEKGFYDMSMDEVAARVGISKVTLYKHFKSKEDLVFSVFYRDFQQFLQNLDKLIMTDLPLQEKIESIIHASILNFSQKDSDFSLPFISSLSELPLFLKSKKKDIEQLEHSLADYLLPILEKGQSEGLINASIPSDILMKILFGIFSSLHMREGFSRQELAELGTRLYMKVILA